VTAPDRNGRVEGTPDHLRFEMLITDITTRFLRIGPGNIDAEIDEALKKIIEFFDSDMCLFLRVNPDANEALLSHVQVSGNLPVPPKVNYVPRSPWRWPKLLRGEIIHVNNLDELPEEAMVDRNSSVANGIQSYLIIPVFIEGTLRYILQLAYARQGPTWLAGYIPRLRVLAEVLVTALERRNLDEASKRAQEEINQLNELLQLESRYLRKEIGLAQSHQGIVGESEAIRKVLRQVEQVASTDTTVLILGETGTGKDLVAREIHGLGGRKERLMVKVDCASLPTTLIESELFGRERGAYTGAMTKQIGRFQLADKGTIFLDEIGELSRETQGKLLRVLQEGCFEVLGSPKTVHVGVRVIAATNRDLAREVRDGRFREDLYYRLNVFAIEVPPLRSRKEDIPSLVWSFVEMFSREMRKEIRRIPKKTMDAMVCYHWPGNVRELRNLIEQAFILSTGDVLTVRLPAPCNGEAGTNQTIEQVERQHILNVLNQTRWRVKGAGGAASVLGLNPSTLTSRMKKLGIPTRRQENDISH
jgi:formate hydrogenlyase transcriptional activator